MMKEPYAFEECTYNIQDGTKRIRCPECKGHGIDISTRGDCKRLIRFKGRIIQCTCYAKEHK